MTTDTGVTFKDPKADALYENLKNGTYEEKTLYKHISRAIEDLKKDPQTGLEIPRDRWPEFYKKSGITNLWKYDLPAAYRLIYTIAKEGVLILCIILEWLTHKKYERRFGYTGK